MPPRHTCDPVAAATGLRGYAQPGRPVTEGPRGRGGSA